MVNVSAKPGSREYHREQAKGLLKNAWEHIGNDSLNGFLHSDVRRSQLIAQANVHALLALSASDES
jgi:hypothetical protein